MIFFAIAVCRHFIALPPPPSSSSSGFHCFAEAAAAISASYFSAISVFALSVFTRTLAFFTISFQFSYFAIASLYFHCFLSCQPLYCLLILSFSFIYYLVAIFIDIISDSH